jgi:hypothetical protein
MKFRTLVEGIRVVLNVATDNVADAVRIASRMRSELQVMGESAERNPSIRAKELLDKGDLFRSEYLKTACRLLGNALIDDNAARAMVDFDDAQFAREQGEEPNELVIDLRHKADIFRSHAVKSVLRLLADSYAGKNQPGQETLTDFDDISFAREQKPATVWVVLYRNGEEWETPAFTSKECATYWVRDRTNNLDGEFIWDNAYECRSADSRIMFTLNETTV